MQFLDVKLAKAEQELVKAEKEAKEAHAQGVAQEKRETARNMLRDQMPVEMIMKYTGLGREKIEQLRNGD